MPNYVRVQDAATGDTYSVLAAEAENSPDAYKVLDESAVDHNGDPLPGVKSGQSPEPTGYEAATVTDLKAEIGRRNADRDEADQLSSQGNKPDLIAALEADDNKES